MHNYLFLSLMLNVAWGKQNPYGIREKITKKHKHKELIRIKHWKFIETPAPSPFPTGVSGRGVVFRFWSHEFQVRFLSYHRLFHL